MNDTEPMIGSEDAVLLGALVGRAARLRPVDTAIEALADALDGARIVDTPQLPRSIVRLGAEVDYEELPGGARHTVTLVAPVEAGAGQGRISVLSPVGRALLGRAEGSTVDVLVPSGARLQLRVRAVRDAARGVGGH